ncbi:MAG: 4-oxalomesaconate tautomerase [Acidobacteria bacterium Pan2503]|uniref:4-oxalomesaconate tautomerase n=1 Tax=Candidatus Acidiferrum panamense TaxID=2741543 RepID=A0A7V8NSA0_9BACT|nr:4-oxalomesaconate tautomerase [Candidatus Acidoferrum panamensis]
MDQVSQTSIPCTLMRGGTSKGPFFVASDLPSDVELRDRVLLAVMGSPDVRQIDGIGGADPLTSKVAIVSRSAQPGIDVDYLFAQVSVDRPLVDVTPTCGNMLAGVGPFAIERGLVVPRDPVTPVRIYMVNTANVAIAHVPTTSGVVSYEGQATIAGVPGTSAAIRIDFLDTAGAVCGALLPTGRSLDELDGMKATLIDNGMPVALLRAEHFGKSGYETPAELDADKNFKARLEEIRIIAGERMGLGDVRAKVVPKMTLIAPPQSGGHVATRTFIPHKCHAAIGVLGAVTVGTACVLPGSVARGIVSIPEGPMKRISVEHPSGEFSLEIEVEEGSGGLKVVRSSLIRTARALFRGEVLVPANIWGGVARELSAVNPRALERG